MESTSQELAATGPSGATQVVPIARQTFWSYDDGGVDQGTSWRQATGSNPWPTAKGPLGYGDSYIATTISYGDPAAKHPTTYFRQMFSIGDKTKVRKLYLRVMYDDGFVFYLNGLEGGRASMPAGPIVFSTLAAGHEADNRYVTYDISSQIPNLRSFDLNTMAVEVHQASRSSSDLVFDAELVTWIDGPFDLGTPQEVKRGSYWRFSDRGGDLGSAWRAPTFDASSWSSGQGPLGFGEQYNVTDLATGPLTTYFRTKFLSEGSVMGLVGEVMYDDGFVVYLNDHEISRASMPSGAITASTLAFGHEANATYQTLDWSAALPHLVRGENTLAVEVHQSSTTSSDLVFDLALRIEGSWHPQASGTSQDLFGVSFLDASRGWAVGGSGTLLHTSNGGISWIAQPSGTTAALRAIQFVDAQHGFIVGAEGTILASSDGGVTWSPRSAGVTVDFVDLSFIDATTGWLVSGADVYRTTDGGTTWTLLPTGTGGTLYGLRFTDAQNGWITGMVPVPGDSWAAIYHTADGGTTWTEQWSSGQHFTYLLGMELVDPQTVWAFGMKSLSNHGELKMVTRNGGATWGAAAETSNGVAVSDMDFIDASFGWAVGFAGTIVHTEDGGTSWTTQQVAQGQQQRLNGVHFVDRNHGWAVGAGGTIAQTANGGR